MHPKRQRGCHTGNEGATQGEGTQARSVSWTRPLFSTGPRGWASPSSKVPCRPFSPTASSRKQQFAPCTEPARGLFPRDGRGRGAVKQRSFTRIPCHAQRPDGAARGVQQALGHASVERLGLRVRQQEAAPGATTFCEASEGACGESKIFVTSQSATPGAHPCRCPRGSRYGWEHSSQRNCHNVGEGGKGP